MSALELSEKLLNEVAGWQAVQRGRAILESRKVLHSEWRPPVLRGLVEAGSTRYRCGLVIKSRVEVENLCTCRESREWGTLCHHSVAVGLHAIRRSRVEAGRTAEREPTASLGELRRRKVEAPIRLRRDLNGTPLRLRLIFPTNLAAAMESGRITVHVQAEGDWGVKPLSALLVSEGYAMEMRDEKLLEALEEHTKGQLPAMVAMDLVGLGRLLPCLVEHPRISRGKEAELAVSPEPVGVALQARLQPDGSIQLTVKEVPETKAPTVVAGERVWLFAGDAFRPLGLPDSCLGVLTGPVSLARPRVPYFLSQDWPVLNQAGTVEADFGLEEFQLEPQAPRFHLALEGGLARLRAQIQCAYGGRILTLGTSSPEESLWLPDPENLKRYTSRDPAAEKAALHRLLKYGFSGPDATGQWSLEGQERILPFFALEYPRLVKEWEVALTAKLEHSVEHKLERIEPSIRALPAGEDWFDLNIAYHDSAGSALNPAEVQSLLHSGRSHRRASNGKFLLLDTGAVEELQVVLRDCDPRQSGGRYQVHHRQAGFLHDAIQRQTGWMLEVPAEWQRRLAATRGEIDLKPPPLGHLEPAMRRYQKHGVAWLHFLRSQGFGGILADEMGLGKTLQTLAHLYAARKDLPREKRRPCLVVCPTSLVFNWQAEAEQWTPQLSILCLHGPRRRVRFSEIPRHDLIITSYALIRRDLQEYEKFSFDTMILDEAQHIKNRQTQNARAVKSIRSDHRLVLTGTPMENSVLDLWSIFDFLMPGYLGRAEDFRERYEVPIVRDRDVRAQSRLASRLRPFLLRRMKHEVAPDLPDKIEQTAFCELTPAQESLYRGLLEAGRNQVDAAVQKHGFAGSRLVIFNALLRLRQVCCDLRLLDLPEPPPQAVSGKLDLFLELLDEAVDGGHRILVFSQFVEMLRILEQALEQRELEYCYLSGATRNRAEVIQRFQSSPDIPVFLISLKAGGVGLNLTAADTVIHYDPWWNPAVEDQATGRAHRIGQTRLVTSYKLITRGTVEEKIMKLQQRKKEIIAGTLGEESRLMESLSWEEIRELFAD